MLPPGQTEPARKGIAQSGQKGGAGSRRVYCGGVDAATKATARTAAGPPPAPPAGARIHARAGLDVLSWPALEQAGLDAIVTTRHGGVSSRPVRLT